jgi:hypothetical protein
MFLFVSKKSFLLKINPLVFQASEHFKTVLQSTVTCHYLPKTIHEKYSFGTSTNRLLCQFLFR